MKLEYIDPFVSSTVRVLKTVLQSDICQGEIALLRGHELTGEVSVVIGLSEAPGENVILNMHTGTALGLCGAMNGAPCTALDGAALDAIGELANMVAGNAVSALSEQGFPYSIRPPETVGLADLPRLTEGLELLQVPVTSEHGLITVNFTIRTN